LLKVLHYAIIQLHVHDLNNRDGEVNDEDQWYDIWCVKEF
jgi:hypothetical protein